MDNAKPSQTSMVPPFFTAVAVGRERGREYPNRQSDSPPVSL